MGGGTAMTTENFGGAPHNETRTPEQSGAATGDGAVNSKERAPIYFKGEITIVPISFEDACVFVANHHRHHQPPVGHKFSIGLANDDGEIIGVAICGRPVARMSDNGWTIEVTRCCTIGTPNACSMLYGADRRASFALGYRRVITYTLPEEGGGSLRGAGYRIIGTRGGGSWSRAERPRVDKAPTQRKFLWEAVA